MSQNLLSQDQVNILYSSIIRSYPGLEHVPPWLKDSEEFWNKYSRGEISFQKITVPYHVARYSIIAPETGKDHYRFDDWGDVDFLKERFDNESHKVSHEKEFRELKTKWKNECNSLIEYIERNPEQRRSLIQAQTEIEDFLKSVMSARYKEESLSDCCGGNIEKAERLRKFFKVRFIEENQWHPSPRQTAHLIKVLRNNKIILCLNNSKLHRVWTKEFAYSGSKPADLGLKRQYEDPNLIKEYEFLVKQFIDSDRDAE